MKRTIIACTILSLMLLVAAVEADAAQSEDITITVTATPALSVSVSSNSLALGSVALGSTTVSSPAIIVTNDGSGAAEVFTLSHSTSDDWTSGTTPGDETFVLNAAFADDVGSATWAHIDSVVSDSVVYNGAENLWFQFMAPTSSAFTTEQSISVTVTAQLP